ncbi:hypothetical protein H6P81_004086 [Aristolochia fimbriata]|uniref:Uncharacterized protein n=1 Tax=Aristolochia fimbriata TaxID=158543 RepID=A0AAV7FEK9_ARIFI|nr:hypothetical protein H6P81_004086 [Aristolochia fimbriata]
MALCKLSSGFSWADEVEEEEKKKLEEENEKSTKRPNPFGSARPREKVLEEKGIDWQKLDQQLNRSSRKEKKQKENIPATTVQAERKGISTPNFRCPKQVPPRTKKGRNAPEDPDRNSGSRRKKEQDLSALVPPLMFPPRNMLALVAEMQNSHGHVSTHVKRPDCYQSRRHLNEHNMELDRVRGNFLDCNSRMAAGLNASIESMSRPYLDNMMPMRTTPQRQSSMADSEFEQRRPSNKVDMDREVGRSFKRRGVKDQRPGGQVM